MQPKLWVKLSNAVGIVGILLLIYWVFVFISIEVFDLKVFRENITETFYVSILGILALLAGALMINIMFNLTRIAEKHNQDINEVGHFNFKRFIGIFLLSFPIIFLLLLTGDWLTSKKREKMLIDTANNIVHKHANEVDTLLNYSFDEPWLRRMDEIIMRLEKEDQNFPDIHVLVKDSIKTSSFFLNFEYYQTTDTIPPIKDDYIFITTQVERDYLNEVFSGIHSRKRFSAHDGHYELYVPYSKNGRTIVFYFTDYQDYGKIGS